jgi:DNA invertase Pin-like site-specific DNA recombinase
MLVGYIHVSEAEGEAALEQQRNAQASSLVRVVRSYEDRTIRRSDPRPQLDACVRGLSSGDILVVWKLGVLGRSLRDLVTLVHELTRRGVGLRVVSGRDLGLDTTAAQGWVMINCFAALAEVERDLNQDRARASLASGLTRGRTGGRPFKMTVAKLRRAQAALEEGTIRVSALCARLGISRQALYRYVDADGQLRPQGEKLLRQGRRSGARPSPTKRPALRITRPPEIPM